jgi:hypothetical protein
VRQDLSHNERTWALRTHGELHFHDGLMALACRERQRRLLASVDRDCDRLAWLTRVATPAEVVGAAPASPESDLPASPDNV